MARFSGSSAKFGRKLNGRFKRLFSLGYSSKGSHLSKARSTRTDVEVIPIAEIGGFGGSSSCLSIDMRSR
jgi:hypothetical protein